jgi:hypothetical protein
MSCFLFPQLFGWEDERQRTKLTRDTDIVDNTEKIDIASQHFLSCLVEHRGRDSRLGRNRRQEGGGQGGRGGGPVRPGCRRKQLRVGLGHRRWHFDHPRAGAGQLGCQVRCVQMLL